jgi:hypothetical protein
MSLPKGWRYCFCGDDLAKNCKIVVLRNENGKAIAFYNAYVNFKADTVKLYPRRVVYAVSDANFDPHTIQLKGMGWEE